ncbi:porphobilinogen synthase [Aquicella lusitana]|uniref:Delta-aminolevulinic acid dehydratase n=1 Tax=Aquicella lusitana TaxID=254246 RepID=A0A370H0Y6_9COXI|nr:porphobilinogen synthase [Aquicella lusitana]RDI48634.1 porphobilinogen synthase [Aquicella lusitana]VVC73989.1 Delta-aminolevulinic acid dehydratase [Aquicella lusitana]
MRDGLFPQTRLRRLRQNQQVRNLVREMRLDADKLVLPIFIRHGAGIKNPIASMPEQFQFSVDRLEEEIQAITALGIRSVILFGIPAEKDPLGQDAYSDKGIVQTAIPVIKKANPDLLVISDLCFCEYTDHGHCGVVEHDHTEKEVNVDNDKTLALLAKQAVSHAKAGADVIAPSGNMDGMVQAIREALDAAGYQHIPILSYSVKYASSLYGPFRQAAEGAPQFGDRRTYQMDFSNAGEAMRECALDVAEGADMLMVKPAHAYLDIIYRVKQAHPGLPLGAYHTSGEYAMIKAAAEKGWVDERKGVLEVLTAIHRAGADFIITYYAKRVAEWLRG